MTYKIRLSERNLHKTFEFIAIITIVLLLSDGCFPVKMAKYHEPSIIAIRNNSGNHISNVSFNEMSVSAKQPVRIGSVSPVLNGTTQIFERPSSPPPLPERVIVSWTSPDNELHEQEVLLKKILADPNAQANEILIFELSPSGRVSVFLSSSYNENNM